MHPIIRFISAGLLCLSFVACNASTEEERSYPYFMSMPSELTIEEKYQRMRHNLSPITAYHFDITIPKGWVTLDTKLTEEPQVGGFAEIGTFRAPGAWMDNNGAEQGGEISVSTVNVTGEERWASVWLKELIEKNVPGARILEEQMIESPNAADILLQYNDGTEVIMTRMAAFRDVNRMFVVSVSDNINGYRDNAEAFYVAIATFTPYEDRDLNPMLPE